MKKLLILGIIAIVGAGTIFVSVQTSYAQSDTGTSRFLAVVSATLNTLKMQINTIKEALIGLQSQSQTTPSQTIQVASPITSSSSVSGTSTPPAAPTNFNAVAVSPYRVLLSWDDNADDEYGFRIFRGLAATSTSLLATTTSNTVGYNDTSELAPNTRYYYDIRSFNEYATSAPVSVSVFTLLNDGKPYAPYLLHGIVSVSTTTSGAIQRDIYLSWDDNSDNEVSMLVERSTISGTYGFQVISWAAKNTTGYKDSYPYVPGKKLWYRIGASNGIGYNLSNVIEIKL